ncbi:MAG: helix-turn-helix domain containing protein [Novosphingobium sp.]|nr:helix-turn-helix domain containing protein [Novosphingobium sp.]
MNALSDLVETELPSAPRPGTYARGTETVDAIIKAALRVLIDEGAGAFTIRRIAAECGMKVGNVSYHFPRKELLIQTLCWTISSAAMTSCWNARCASPGWMPRNACA